MKIRTVLNNTQLLEAYNGICQIERRCVDIKLTEEQVKQLGIKCLGRSLGKEIYETIESVCIIDEPEGQ